MGDDDNKNYQNYQNISYNICWIKKLSMQELDIDKSCSHDLWILFE